MPTSANGPEILQTIIGELHQREWPTYPGGRLITPEDIPADVTAKLVTVRHPLEEIYYGGFGREVSAPEDQHPYGLYLRGISDKQFGIDSLHCYFISPPNTQQLRSNLGYVSLYLHADGLRVSASFNDLDESPVPIDRIKTLVNPLGSYLSALATEEVVSNREYYARKRRNLDTEREPDAEPLQQVTAEDLAPLRQFVGDPLNREAFMRFNDDFADGIVVAQAER